VKKNQTWNEIAGILAKKDRFLIVSHVNPDGDAIGALLGLALALEEMGKDVWAHLPDSRPALYSFLPAARNLVGSEYEAPQDRDWIISLDAADESRIACSIDIFRDKARLLNIDHHPTNPMFGDMNLVVPEANSTAEMVFKLLEIAGHDLSRQVGICLYTGLVTDTGCFRYSGVNGETFRIAARLLDTGIDSYEVCQRIYEEFPPYRLQLEKKILERMEISLDGRLCVSVLYQKDFDIYGGGPSDIEGVVNKLRGISGVEVGALITEIDGNGAKASLRSKGLVDVALVAASLGGGGHSRASGLKSRLGPDKLKSLIMKAVEEAMNPASTKASYT
jgi:phosphoesterase RecJ-like protein